MLTEILFEIFNFNLKFLFIKATFQDRAAKLFSITISIYNKISRYI